MADHNRICDGAGDVERVAMAICTAAGRNPYHVTMGTGSVGFDQQGTPYSTSEIHQRAWQQHIGQARAAIAAMPVSAGYREKVLAIVSKWQGTQHMQLHAGEMTAQEKRSVKAVLGAIEREIAALSDDDGKEGR